MFKCLFGEISIEIVCSFLKTVLVVSIILRNLVLTTSLCILGMNTLWHMYLATIVSQSVACLHSFNNTFGRIDHFNFNEIQPISSFMDHVFDVVSKQPFPNPGHLEFLLCYLLEIL